MSEWLKRASTRLTLWFVAYGYGVVALAVAAIGFSAGFAFSTELLP